MPKTKTTIPWVMLTVIYLAVCLICFGMYSFGEPEAAIACLIMFSIAVVLIVGGFWFWEWATPTGLNQAEESESSSGAIADQEKF